MAPWRLVVAHVWSYHKHSGLNSVSKTLPTHRGVPKLKRGNNSVGVTGDSCMLEMKPKCSRYCSLSDLVFPSWKNPKYSLGSSLPLLSFPQNGCVFGEHLLGVISSTGLTRNNQMPFAIVESAWLRRGNLPLKCKSSGRGCSMCLIP